MTKQGEIMEQELDNWMGSYAQIDDILVLGFRI